MLNAERVILMTRLAAYENGEGKKNVAVGKYFRSDYIKMQTIKSIIYATIAFVVLVALMVLMDIEAFMGDIYQMDLIGTRFLKYQDFVLKLKTVKYCSAM